MTKEKNWDAWKDHPTSEERAIFRYEAEQEQIETKPMGILDGGYKEIHVRGVFVGGCPEDYEVRLRLGTLHRPMVSIKTPAGVVTFTANLEEAEG
ncbi:hypothetical protein ES707_10090 [subsurface metagenome]